MNIKDKNIRAVALMSASVVIFSAVPLIFYLGNAIDSPLIFHGVLMLSSSIPIIIYLIREYEELFFDKENWHLLLKNFYRKEMLLPIIGQFGYLSFVYSLSYVDVSVASMLFESWALLTIFITAYLFRKKEKYRSMTVIDIWFLVVGVAGMGFVVLSQTNNSINIVNILNQNYSLIGIGLAVLGAVLASFAPAFSLFFGVELAKERGYENDNDKSFFFIMICVIISGAIGGIISIIIGFATGEAFIGKNILWAFVYGSLFFGVGSIFFRRANILTEHLGINVMLYLTPVGSLIWLYSFNAINVPQTDLLIIGMAAIVMSNLLINYKAEVRIAYMALILTLWFFGAFVSLHSPIRFADFSNTLAISITIFILILSFRADRLVRRTANEEHIYLKIWQDISILSDNKLINDCRKSLMVIDSKTTIDDIKQSYRFIKTTIIERRNIMGDEYRKDFNAILSDVDMLTHSKQQGANFGEITALCIMATINIGILLFFTHDKVSGIGLFVIDMFSFLIASSVLFLLFNIFDLENDRRKNVIEEQEEGYANDAFIHFSDIKNRGLQKLLSVGVSAFIIICYFIILWNKYQS